jgi:DNA-binding IscR family transcriptional regulator
LAKILQRLATAGVLLSHHGIKGGYTHAASAEMPISSWIVNRKKARK